MEDIAIGKAPAKKAVSEEIQPRRVDRQIWGIYIMLCLISVIELYAASSHEVRADNVFAPVIRHIMFLLGGLAIILTLERMHYKHFLRFSTVFALASVGLMVCTLLFGEYINGARRSINILGISIQPAEMIKISVVMVIAGILSKSQMKKGNDVSYRGLVWLAACVTIACGLLFSQGLTNTLLLVAISFSMMLIGGVSIKKICLVLAIFAIGGGGAVGVKMLKSHSGTTATETVTEQIVVPGTNIVVGGERSTSSGGLQRSKTWKNRLARHFKRNKYNDPIDDINQQEQYSYIAQAHGGILGVGIGNSRESARLPLAFSDYIYAIVIEELGLLGGIFVLILYLWLLARAGRIAQRCQTAYPALLVIGMAVFITFQAIFHMCIVTGVFPVSGQPLPLISKGGTSILITSMALGIMLSVSRYAARKGKKSEIKDELKALPTEVNAANPV